MLSHCFIRHCQAAERREGCTSSLVLTRCKCVCWVTSPGARWQVLGVLQVEHLKPRLWKQVCATVTTMSTDGTPWGRGAPLNLPALCRLQAVRPQMGSL